ncbi:unnamed protein product [Miscanthus lutarioriparius]|uniref:Reverse transcriptase zinc-binding domain-containing protein n=1 Tax=Miscanthus lutarioriparius TaxID=422564 RepID=A0A811MP72_9POAL|nr:unnamed protein product [Miscanthus lutarioriparius]
MQDENSVQVPTPKTQITSLKFERYRLTLVTAILSTPRPPHTHTTHPPLHVSSESLNIPKTAIKAIDRRRRAFFWTGDEVCHGSRCLVAWENVSISKNDGGLGVKNLELQNRCILMKFINKLFSNEPAPWKQWILRDAASFDTPSNSSTSYLWRIVNDELTTYRSITYVKVRDGASTSFWFDHWLPAGPLYVSHSALFSHTTRPNVSVQDVFQARFDLRLRSRLTNAAATQLADLLLCLQETNLGDGADERRLKHTGKVFTARDAYATPDRRSDTPDVHGRHIWGTRLPNKVKIFAWLYFKDRLSTRGNLFAKHVLDDDACQRCSGCVEDRQHVFFDCTSSAELWQMLQMSSVAELADANVWTGCPLPHLDAKLCPFVFLSLTILSRIWDARNAEVFGSEPSSSRRIITRVCDDPVIWQK